MIRLDVVLAVQLAALLDVHNAPVTPFPANPLAGLAASMLVGHFG